VKLEDFPLKKSNFSIKNPNFVFLDGFEVKKNEWTVVWDWWHYFRVFKLKVSDYKIKIKGIFSLIGKSKSKLRLSFVRFQTSFFYIFFFFLNQWFSTVVLRNQNVQPKCSTKMFNQNVQPFFLLLFYYNMT
jgi:hypothetical protein